MKFLGTTSLATLFVAGAAMAGGIERSPQSMNVLFEDGRYFEFGGSFGNPSVSGVGGPLNPTPGVNSGNMTENFLTFGAAYKADLNDQLSYAIIYDQPYGADVFYPATSGYAFAGSNADFTSHALTGVLQYNMDGGFSVYGGLRAQTVEAEARVLILGGLGADYNVTGDRDLAFGYLAGVAYEKPEIALRVALTYHSEIEHELDTLENGVLASVTPIETPKSWNLEFQSGVAEDTLVFGSIKWAEWTAFDIAPVAYVGAFGAPLVSFADDRVTYTLGVGRRLNEQWSVLGSLSHEKTTGSLTGNLGPTDGFTSVSLGAIYTKDNMKVTGGVRYVDVGDANTTAGAAFRGNTALAAGLKVGFSF